MPSLGEKIMSLDSAKSLNSNMPFSSQRAIKALDSIGFLQTDFETIFLTDGTQIQRERQTKAQAKIQALKIKHRNENLRRKLISLSDEHQSAKQKVATDQCHTNGGESLEEVSTLNDISAIQKQIIANSEKVSDSYESDSSEKQDQVKSAESKLVNLKKLIFG